VSSRENRWLSVGKLALLLESARIIGCEAHAAGDPHSRPCVYELVTTFMLTGAREGEIACRSVSGLWIPHHPHPRFEDRAGGTIGPIAA
jgi:hypothetical protein